MDKDHVQINRKKKYISNRKMGKDNGHSKPGIDQRRHLDD